MSIGKYISIEDYKERIRRVVQNITNEIAKKENIKAEDIRTNVVLSKKGKLLNLTALNVKGIILSDEQPEVYHFKPTLPENNLKDTKTIGNHHVRIMVKALGTVDSNNVLDLPKDRYTFKRYEDYLEFFTDKYRDKNVKGNNQCVIQTIVKDTGCSLSTILTGIVETMGIVERTITNADFTSLERYRKLPISVRQEVDKQIYLLTVESKNVSVNRLSGVINVHLGEHDIVKRVRCTDTYKDELKHLMETSP